MRPKPHAAVAKSAVKNEKHDAIAASDKSRFKSPWISITRAFLFTFL